MESCRKTGRRTVPKRLALPAGLAERLARRARQELRSEAAILRDALTAYLGKEARMKTARWQGLGGLRETWLQGMAEQGAPVEGLQETTARMLTLLLEAAAPGETVPQRGRLDARLRAVAADVRQAAAFLRACAEEADAGEDASGAAALARWSEELEGLARRLVETADAAPRA